MTATPQLTDISSLITQVPGVYGGRPCLGGTRFPVSEVAVQYNAGGRPEAIAEEYHLPLDQVYAAIAFYLLNKAAIDQDLREEREAWEEGRREQDARTGPIP